MQHNCPNYDKYTIVRIRGGASNYANYSNYINYSNYVIVSIVSTLMQYNWIC